MADVNRGNRPLSPHLDVYRFSLTMATSIFHRITGCGLAVSGILVVWWFLAAARGPDRFAFADWLLTSWIGGLALLLSVVALWYHFFNGIRHLIWTPAPASTSTASTAPGSSSSAGRRR